MSSGLREIKCRLSSTYKYVIAIGFIAGAILSDDEAMAASSVNEFFARVFSDSFLISSVLMGVIIVGMIMLVALLSDGFRS